MRMGILLWLTLLGLSKSALLAEMVPVGKVVYSYVKEDQTNFLVEVNKMLTTQQIVYLQGEVPLAIREIVAVQETQNTYYYKAIHNGKVRVLSGEVVYLKIGKGKEPQLEESRIKQFEQATIFMKKKLATVNIVEDSKAMINRGSVHDVDKRDVYKVIDQNGRVEGLIELYGVGDFVSTGRIRRPIEYGGGWATLREGDEAVYVGNRMKIGIGIVGSYHKSDGKTYSGFGMLWNWGLGKGLVAEWLWGSFFISETEADTLKEAQNIKPSLEHRISLPFWVRKSFFYPGLVSPSLLLGVGVYRTELEKLYSPSGGSPAIVRAGVDRGEDVKRGYAPLVGAGLDILSGGTTHIRLDLHYYITQDLKFLSNTYKTKSLFPTAGITLNW